MRGSCAPGIPASESNASSPPHERMIRRIRCHFSMVVRRRRFSRPKGPRLCGQDRGLQEARARCHRWGTKGGRRGSAATAANATRARKSHRSSHLPRPRGGDDSVFQAGRQRENGRENGRRKEVAHRSRRAGPSRDGHRRSPVVTVADILRPSCCALSPPVVDPRYKRRIFMGGVGTS